VQYRRDLQRALKKHELHRYAAAIETACEQAREYSRRAPSLHPMRSKVHQAGVRAFFVSLYDKQRNAIEQIKEDLRRHVLTEDVMRAVCQYCGFPAPETLDHFLEKARFPELSLYKRNLIPCCWVCNHDRKASFSSNGERPEGSPHFSLM
jgi:5-methylcytosine-specific restriction endonuclease McrA